MSIQLDRPIATPMSFASVVGIQAAFERLGIAQIHDAAGKYCSVINSFAGRTRVTKFCGPVYPVWTPGDGLPVLQAIAKAAPGSIVLAFNESSEPCGLIGDILVTSAIQRGLAGMVVRGGVRDIDQIFDMGLPVYSTAVSCVKGELGSPKLQMPEPVAIDGATIAPNDWLFADGDGMIVVEGTKVRAAVIAGKMLTTTEEKVRQRLRAGVPFTDVVGLTPEGDVDGDLVFIP